MMGQAVDSWLTYRDTSLVNSHEDDHRVGGEDARARALAPTRGSHLEFGVRNLPVLRRKEGRVTRCPRRRLRETPAGISDDEL